MLLFCNVFVYTVDKKGLQMMSEKFITDEKTPMHMRLTGTARNLLLALSKKKGVSQTAVVELAIRMIAEAEGVKAEGNKDNGND